MLLQTSDFNFLISFWKFPFFSSLSLKKMLPTSQSVSRDWWKSRVCSYGSLISTQSIEFRADANSPEGGGLNQLNLCLSAGESDRDIRDAAFCLWGTNSCPDPVLHSGFHPHQNQGLYLLAGGAIKRYQICSVSLARFYGPYQVSQTDFPFRQNLALLFGGTNSSQPRTLILFHLFSLHSLLYVFIYLGHLTWFGVYPSHLR